MQTIVTTHSPTVAAHVDPKTIHVLHRPPEEPPRCVSIGACKLDDAELKQLRRMFDVTRASLLFARGVLLVEGISEALLMPVLGRRIGCKLEDAGVSVICVAGVEFTTLAKLFGPDKLRLPVAIVTDADRAIVHPDPTAMSWETAKPAADANGYVPGKRVTSLRQEVANTGVAVFASDVTLEHDLAAAGPDNPRIIFDAWRSLYKRGPQNLTEAQLTGATSTKEKALMFWRAVCLGDPSHGKAELAQALAAVLDERQMGGAFAVGGFTIPPYLEKAIMHVFQAK